MHDTHGSWLHFLTKLLPSWIPEPVYFSWVVMLLLSAFAYFATKDLKKVPGSLQAFAEIVVEGLDKFTKGVIGPQGGKFTPLIGSFFLYILVMNAMGNIPGFLPPTSNLNTTLALALVTMCAIQYGGISANGLGGHIKHYWGSPFLMGFLMFPIHALEDIVIKPFSLAVRLRSNIFGDETAVLGLIALLPALWYYIIPIPTYALMLVLGILVVVVQALIFSLLSAIYISIAIGHHDDEHHESAAAHH